MRNIEATVGNLIDSQKVAFISSIDMEGYPNTKVMFTPSSREGIKTLYFSTSLSSLMIQQYQQDPKACVYFFNKRFYRGVMLRGRMEILTDEKSLKRYQQNTPEIKSDPCILKFTAYQGRFYSHFKSENFDIK